MNQEETSLIFDDVARVRDESVSKEKRDEGVEVIYYRMVDIRGQSGKGLFHGFEF